jgi:anaerobic ribonucleoside-triphosphate reductase activating protein
MEIDRIMTDNEGVNCVLFMGEGNDIPSLLELNKYVKDKYDIETGIYSGSEKVPNEYYDVFDYVKVGPYISEKGPLNKETTNQRMYYHKKDITSKFWRKRI